MSNNRDKTRNVAPIRLELLVTIVPKSKGAFYVDLIQSFDVNMQVSVPAQGTADRELLHFLGLTDTDKTVIFSVVREDRLDALLDELNTKFRTIKDGAGVAASVPFSSMVGTLLFGFLSDERMVREEAPS